MAHDSGWASAVPAKTALFTCGLTDMYQRVRTGATTGCSERKKKREEEEEDEEEEE